MIINDISTIVKLPGNVKVYHVLDLIAASCGNKILSLGGLSNYIGVKVDFRWLKLECSDSHSQPEFFLNPSNIESIKVCIDGKYKINLRYYLETKTVTFSTYWDRKIKNGGFPLDLAIALSIRLVSFFGGKVCFEYRYGYRVDFKENPKTDRENNPSRDKDFWNLTHRIRKVKPVNREELRRAKKLYQKLYGAK